MVSLLLIVIGLVLTGGCGYLAWQTIEIILSGMYSGNLAMVIGGGIIAYLTIAVLAVGVIAGLGAIWYGIFD